MDKIVAILERAIRYHVREAALWQSESLIPEWVYEAKEELASLKSLPKEPSEGWGDEDMKAACIFGKYGKVIDIGSVFSDEISQWLSSYKLKQ